MAIFIFLIWTAIAFAVASVGKNRRIGYNSTLALSFFLSPIVGLIAALVSPVLVPVAACPHCGFTKDATMYYCPRCFKDAEGFTAEQNKNRVFDKNTFINPAVPVKEKMSTLAKVGWGIIIAFVVLIIIQMIKNG